MSNLNIFSEATTAPQPAEIETGNLESQNHTGAGNNNCNRDFVDESFYNALAAFGTNKILNKFCHIDSDYVTVDILKHDTPTSVFYDNRAKRIMNEPAWEKKCWKYTVKQMKKREKALKRQGLFFAFNSLKRYLESHTTLKQIVLDENNGVFTPKIIKKELKYGYKLDGFEKRDDVVIWRIVTYERPVKQNDVVRGIDNCYLATRGEITVEVANRIDYELINGNRDFSDDEYKTYIKEYVDISNIN